MSVFLVVLAGLLRVIACSLAFGLVGAAVVGFLLDAWRDGSAGIAILAIVFGAPLVWAFWPWRNYP